jgi:diguanylate cyclase (GGDEF)-like protein
LAGDDCLKQIASCIRSAAKRASDVTARLGGEEFAILLPNTSESAARNLAAQLLESIQALSIIHLGGETGLLTASVGIASIGSKPAPDKAVSLLSKADAALYESKSRGRNRVTVAA